MPGRLPPIATALGFHTSNRRSGFHAGDAGGVEDTGTDYLLMNSRRSTGRRAPAPQDRRQPFCSRVVSTDPPTCAGRELTAAGTSAQDQKSPQENVRLSARSWRHQKTDEQDSVLRPLGVPSVKHPL